MDETSDKPPGTADSRWRKLLKSTLIPFAGGALYGFLLRLVFSDWFETAKAGVPSMWGAFLFGAPFVVGAITIYFAEAQRRRSWAFYVFAPWLATAIFVGGTAISLIEGWVCIALALPVFLIVGSLGGIAMGITCRVRQRPLRTVQGLALLPLVLALAEGQYGFPQRHGEIRATTRIAAPPALVWKQLHNAGGIRAEEIADAWAYRIGVPRPLEGQTAETETGRVRTSLWERGVRFDEIITDWRPDQYVRWSYRFAPGSFPPGALDDHVRIGGRYFDLADTSFTLQPIDHGTELTLRVTYRVSTHFNWYADALAQGLLGNFAEVILRFYKQRAERDAA